MPLECRLATRDRPELPPDCRLRKAILGRMSTLGPKATRGRRPAPSRNVDALDPFNSGQGGCGSHEQGEVVRRTISAPKGRLRNRAR